MIASVTMPSFSVVCKTRASSGVAERAIKSNTGSTIARVVTSTMGGLSTRVAESAKLRAHPQQTTETAAPLTTCNISIGTQSLQGRKTKGKEQLIKFAFEPNYW